MSKGEQILDRRKYCSVSFFKQDVCQTYHIASMHICLKHSSDFLRNLVKSAHMHTRTLLESRGTPVWLVTERKGPQSVTVVRWYEMSLSIS